MTKINTPEIILCNYDKLWQFSAEQTQIVCLSERDISLILSHLSTAHWRARWVDANGRKLRNVGRSTDIDLALDYLEELEGRLLMNCGEEIRLGLESMGAALQAGLQAIANRPCCPVGGTTGTIGGIGTGGTGVEPSNPVDTTGIGYDTPPEGFEDWQDYADYKCAVATFIVAQLREDFQKISTANFVGLSTAGAILALLGIIVATPIAGEVLILIAGFLLAALASGVLDSVLAGIETALGAANDDLICALYCGSSVESSRQNAEGVVADAIDAELADVPAYLAKQIINLWFGDDSLNRLFEQDTTYNYPAGDCDLCCQVSWAATWQGRAAGNFSAANKGAGLWWVEYNNLNAGGFSWGGWALSSGANGFVVERIEIIDTANGLTWDYAGPAYPDSRYFLNDGETEIDQNQPVDLPIGPCEAIWTWSLSYCRYRFHVRLV